MDKHAGYLVAVILESHCMYSMPSSSSSAYTHKPGGSLKFKGGETVQKKKKKNKSSTSLVVRDTSGSRSGSSSRLREAQVGERENSERESGEQSYEMAKTGRPMTEAERKFEEVRRKRMEERVAKEAKLSHKDRVDQFNKSLVERTEHNDMLTVSGH